MYNVCKLCRKDKCIPIYVCVLFCLQKKDCKDSHFRQLIII